MRAFYWRTRLGAMGARCSIDVGVIFGSPEFIFLGDDVWVDNYVMLVAGPPGKASRASRVITNPAYRGAIGELTIGNRTHIGPYALIQGHGGVSIGDDTTVGAHTAIYSFSHHYRFEHDESNPDDYHSVPKYSGLAPAVEQAMLQGAVALGNACAVLANSVVLPGSAVGRYTVVGASSLVQGVVPAGVIASGNPLQIRKQRFGREILER